MGLRAQLADRLPENVLPQISDHFEVIGDVAVLSLPDELRPYGRTIAGAIVEKRANIYTVLNKTGTLAGPYRTGSYEVLYGGTTVTMYHEFGFSYRLDVARSFFSARMAYERRRVTEQVEPGERVYVPFAGVGPFAIPAAARGADVVAIEKNPGAFTFLLENVKRNHAEGCCHVLQGDALEPALLPHSRFDRLIIPAPYGMDRALDILLPLLRGAGMAHFYTFKGKEQIPALIEEYEKRGLVITYYSNCGNVAPGISRWVFDLAYPLYG